jgi:CheY-like chemotaxis protein/anti-sigma regulatory factor (Ser/Thr protein kinase)
MPDQVAKVINEMVEVTDKALTYTRTLISQLSPPVLPEFGLPMALHWLAEQVRQQNLSVSVQVKSEMRTIPEDHALLLFQSIRELLINCVKHAHTDEAAVTLEEVAGSLCIRISDQGAGFDVLASAHKHEQSPARGGFGLLNIRERMLSLGGKFELTSSPGQGTTATLALPLSDTAVQAVGQAYDHERAPVRTRGPSRVAANRSISADGSLVRVLLADDHAMVRQGLCSVLEQYSDIQVVGEAANGEEAVALAETLQPDVILMDVNMPKLNGVEATRRLTLKHPGVAVIGLSIDVAEQVEVAMIKAGAVAFMNKEAAVYELYQTIQTARRAGVHR